MEMNWVAWIIVAVVLVIIEILTPSTFFFMCFSIGALFAALVAYFNISNWLELAVFAIISVASIYSFRPFLKESIFKKADKVQSNVDELIGAVGTVTERITPEKPGLVKVLSEIWLAESDTVIEQGETVIVKSLSGTKVFVKK